VQFLHRRPAQQIPPELACAYEEFVARVEPRVFTPASSHARRLSLDPIRLPRADELAGIDNPARRAEEEASMIEAVAVNLASLADLKGDRAAQETFLLQVLRGMPRGATVSLAEVVRCVREPSPAHIDEPDAFIKDATRTNLALRLNALVHGPAAALFTGGTPLDIDAMLRPTSEGRGRRRRGWRGARGQSRARSWRAGPATAAPRGCPSSGARCSAPTRGRGLPIGWSARRQARGSHRDRVEAW
jgi:hypothetical protein